MAVWPRPLLPQSLQPACVHGGLRFKLVGAAALMSARCSRRRPHPRSKIMPSIATRTRQQVMAAILAAPRPSTWPAAPSRSTSTVPLVSAPRAAAGISAFGSRARGCIRAEHARSGHVGGLGPGCRGIHSSRSHMAAPEIRGASPWGQAVAVYETVSSYTSNKLHSARCAAASIFGCPIV